MSRAAVRLLALAALPLGLVTAVTGAPAAPRPVAFRADQPAAGSLPTELLPTPAGVVLTGISPVTARPGRTLVLSGTIRNLSASAQSDLSVSLEIGRAIPDRAALHDDARNEPTLDAPVGAAVVAVGAKSIAPGSFTSFTVSVPLDRVEQLDPSAVGVYPVQVQVSGLDGAVARQLGEATTFLPWFPVTVASPLQLATLWPLDLAPQLDGTGRALTGTALVRELASGRLAQLLAATRPRQVGGKAIPHAAVSWFVDPSLLQAITLLEHPWRVTGRPGAQAADPRAAAFLSGLSAAAGRGALLALPYADPDMLALRRAGLATDIGSTLHLAAQTVQAVLHLDPQTTTAWPVDGLVDQPTLDALASAGVDTVVLDDRQIPTSPLSSYTASAVTSLATSGPTVRAVAADSYLAGLLGHAAAGAPSVRMALQLVLAETALVVAERPNGISPRALVLAPPRYWAPGTAYARGLLELLARAGWLRTVTLPQAAAGPIGARLPLQPYPGSARARELPQGDLAAAAGPASVASLRAALTDVSGMLGDQNRLTPLEEALDRAESAGWRAPGPGPAPGSVAGGGASEAAPGGEAAQRRAVGDQIASIVARVRVASAPQITLTSRHGTLPVTIANDLSDPVTVLLHVLSPDPTKLTTPPQTVEHVGPHQKLRVLLPAVTQRAGVFSVSLLLTMPDGRPLGAPVPIIVHSSAYGGLALAITGGALVVLVLALVARAVPRRRRRAAPA